MDDSGARYSLVAGEGDGTMLGLAAGDSAGGAWELGYSAHTEQATVVAYHVIEHGRLIPDELIDQVCELDGSQEEQPVYRSESPQFRSWLDTAAAGRPQADDGASLDACPRSVPLGVVNRRDPEKLRSEVVELGLLFHTDALTILGGAVTAAAVAASCFGQTGRDLIAGVVETVAPIADDLAAHKDVVGTSALDAALGGLANLLTHVGVGGADEALAVVSGADPGRPWDLLMAGLLLVAPLPVRDHLPVEQAAKLGGSALGSVIGAIVGARVGIRAWPWTFANDTWFAEIGRRLVRGPAEIRDLPIPYAVEHHLITGTSPTLHR